MAERERSALERGFERVLWGSRYLALIAVVGSLVAALAIFAIAAVGLVRGILAMAQLPGVAGAQLEYARVAVVGRIAGSVDGFLFALVLLIFALGIYELFVGPIAAAERSPFARRILLVGSLDDLKERLAGVILLILIVRYFEYALDANVRDGLDLLMLAVGIVLIAGALFFTNRRRHE
ncbi:MAG: YqhA family protein [Vulcanimicrobiaceae bacterium]